MDTSSMQALAERVERLEVENQWLKRLGSLVVVGVAALGIHGTNLGRPAGQVEAERFVVKDSRGRVRASLSMQPDGEPGLTILDDRGREQIALRATSDRTSTLEFKDRGRPRLAMSASSSGATNLNLFDRRSGIGAGLYVWPDDEAGLAMNRGLNSFVLGVTPDGTPRATVSDEEGRQYGGPVVDDDGRLTVLDTGPSPSGPAISGGRPRPATPEAPPTLDVTESAPDRPSAPALQGVLGLLGIGLRASP